MSATERDGRKKDGGQRGVERNEHENEKTDDEKKGREDVMVLSADEVGTWHEAVIRRAWCKRCAKTRIGVDRERQSQKYIGVLHESDGRVDLMRLERCNTDSVVGALTELTLKYPDKTIIVVWDNAGWYKSSALLAQTGRGEAPGARPIHQPAALQPRQEPRGEGLERGQELHQQQAEGLLRGHLRSIRVLRHLEEYRLFKSSR